MSNATCTGLFVFKKKEMEAWKGPTCRGHVCPLWPVKARDCSMQHCLHACLCACAFPGSVSAVTTFINGAKTLGYTLVSIERCLWGPNFQRHPSWVCGSDTRPASSLHVVAFPVSLPSVTLRLWIVVPLVVAGVRTPTLRFPGACLAQWWWLPLV